MHQVLLIISAITSVSVIAQFYMFLFTVSITYQSLLLLSLQYSYQVGFPIRHPYKAILYPQSLHQQLLLVTSISTPYQLLSSPTIYLQRQQYHILVSILVSSFGISCFCNLRVSALKIKYSSQIFPSASPLKLLNFSTHNHYTISYSFQLLPSPNYTVATQTTCYRYSFQLILPATPSYSYQLLLSAARNSW